METASLASHTLFRILPLRSAEKGLVNCLYHFGSVRQDLGVPIRLQYRNAFSKRKYAEKGVACETRRQQ